MPFRWAAALPLVLLVVLGALWLRDRARGGYRVVTLAPGGPDRPLSESGRSHA